MSFKEVFSILPDTKDSHGNNPYEVSYTCGFDPNTEFSRPLLKTYLVCVEK